MVLKSHKIKYLKLPLVLKHFDDNNLLHIMQASCNEKDKSHDIYGHSALKKDWIIIDKIVGREQSLCGRKEAFMWCWEITDYRYKNNLIFTSRKSLFQIFNLECWPTSLSSLLRILPLLPPSHLSDLITPPLLDIREIQYSISW